ncbi:MAG: DNA polymerase/3'-5' exonuclease PolX [Planctomycetota bacterium]
MPSRNVQLARIFEDMALLSELLGGNRFKVIAYQKAARVVGEMTRDVGEFARGELTGLEGIGTGAADRILEFVETGKVADFEKLAKQVPPGVLDVMNIPGVGPKSAAVFWKQLGVESIDDLKGKLESGEVAELKGFGPKKVQNIEKALKFAESAGQRVRIGTAYALANLFVDAIRGLPGIEAVEYAGSLRRGKETIGDVDVLAAVDPSEAEKVAAVFDAFANHEAVDEVLLRGDTKCSVRTTKEFKGMQADLRVVAPESFGAALMYFTGSKEHNVKMRERAIARGMSLNEYGLTKDDKTTTVAAKSEQDVFAALDLAWVPPELREDRGELKLAEAGAVPKLLALSDIAAELHTHTTASDGVWSIEENALGAAARGFHTVAITDHSRGQVQANGLTAERLEQHILAVREVAAKLKDTITVLAGSEVDILTDGGLDYPDELLAELDIVVASPHASLQQDPKTSTKRLLKAIENPYVTIMGHPTGRIVLRREGMSPDVEALAKAAAERGIALEINANPYRMDLRDTHVAVALEHGCKLAINTDAHGPGDLEHLRFGVLTARRGGATKADVVNAMSRDELAEWIASTRP